MDSSAPRCARRNRKAHCGFSSTGHSILSRRVRRAQWRSIVEHRVAPAVLHAIRKAFGTFLGASLATPCPLVFTVALHPPSVPRRCYCIPQRVSIEEAEARENATHVGSLPLHGTLPASAAAARSQPWPSMRSHLFRQLRDSRLFLPCCSFSSTSLCDVFFGVIVSSTALLCPKNAQQLPLRERERERCKRKTGMLTRQWPSLVS